ncbi:MAG: RNA-binding domain-containing protein [Nitrososphaerales archaeon]
MSKSSTAGWNKTRADIRVNVTLEATLAPSEDPRKVLDAMRSIFPENTALADQSSRMIKMVSEEASSLNVMREQLRDRHIRSAARRLLLSALKGDSTSLMLNRQAATVGVVALCSSADQSPLGPIYVTIRSKQIEALIDWLAAYEEG